MTDAEVIARLRTIVTIGNPDRKYQKVDKIGSGSVSLLFLFLGVLIEFNWLNNPQFLECRASDRRLIVAGRMGICTRRRVSAERTQYTTLWCSRLSYPIATALRILPGQLQKGHIQSLSRLIGRIFREPAPTLWTEFFDISPSFRR